MTEALWNRHYTPGVMGSFHGDMARAFDTMLIDPECDVVTRRRLGVAISIHKAIERSPQYPENERKWFTERFGDDHGMG